MPHCLRKLSWRTFNLRYLCRLYDLKLLSVMLAAGSSCFLTACVSTKIINNDDVYKNHTKVVASIVGQPTLIKSWQANELYQTLKTLRPTAQSHTPIPACDVLVKKFTYNTVGAAGEPTTATAALMLPQGAAGNCHGKRPILLHAHGTAISRRFDFSQVGLSDNEAQMEATMVAANFAGQGYIVVAPNYAGYDTSPLPYHPYLNAKQQASDMYGALQVARQLLKNDANANIASDTDTDTDSDADTHSDAQQSSYPLTASDKLFVSGYSQGGHVALATARYLGYLNEPITAVATQSGPYALAAFGDAIFMGNVNVGATVLAPLLGRSYQHAYGYSVKGAYTPKYEQAATLFPSEVSFQQLVDTGRLPQTELFQKAPTGIDALDDKSPADSRFFYGFDANDYLITNQYRADYLADAKVNPDGLFDDVLIPLTARHPQNNMRQALKTNDLRTYIPPMPVLLCGGNQDPVVFYDVNTTFVSKLWQGLEPYHKNPVNVTVLDVDSSNAKDRTEYQTISYIGKAVSYEPWFDKIAQAVDKQFSSSRQAVVDKAKQQAIDSAITEGKDEQMVEQSIQDAIKFAAPLAYHDVLVAEACTNATRQYFAHF